MLDVGDEVKKRVTNARCKFTCKMDEVCEIMRQNNQTDSAQFDICLWSCVRACCFAHSHERKIAASPPSILTSAAKQQNTHAPNENEREETNREKQI